jgi:hypothetical protein
MSISRVFDVTFTAQKIDARLLRHVLCVPRLPTIMTREHTTGMLCASRASCAYAERFGSNAMAFSKQALWRGMQVISPKAEKR